MSIETDNLLFNQTDLKDRSGRTADDEVAPISKLDLVDIETSFQGPVPLFIMYSTSSKFG